MMPGNGAISGKRVLIVEDEFLVAAMLSDILEDEGAHPVGPAASLAEALRCVDHEAFDVAVVDWNLDGERSDPLGRALLAAGRPFVISTGYGAVEPEFAGVPILPKPYDPGELVRILSALLTAD